jgi:hypothetical protein
MVVNGGHKCHQIDCHTLNFAWNTAPGMHLAWNDPGKLNSVKCRHFPPNASPKIPKWLLMVDRNAIKLLATCSISRGWPSISRREYIWLGVTLCTETVQVKTYGLHFEKRDLGHSKGIEMACILKSVIWGIQIPLKWLAF